MDVAKNELEAIVEELITTSQKSSLAIIGRKVIQRAPFSKFEHFATRLRMASLRPPAQAPLLSSLFTGLQYNPCSHALGRCARPGQFTSGGVLPRQSKHGLSEDINSEKPSR